MSNYVDKVQVDGSDYNIKVTNGVTFRNPTSITPETNPVIRKNDLIQTLNTSQTAPPSSKAVKDVTDALSSHLVYNSWHTSLPSAQSGGDDMYVYKWGRMAYFALNSIKGLGTSRVQLGNIASGFRPAVNVALNVHDTTGRPYEILLNASGDVFITASTAASAKEYIHALVPFITA